MSEENVELAWQVPEVWNDGGADGLIEYLDADVEWLPPRESLEPGIYRGHDGVRYYLGRLAAIFEEARQEGLAVIDVDDERVILVMRTIAPDEQSAIEVTADWARLITVGANKKVIRVEAFTDKAQALKAMALA